MVAAGVKPDHWGGCSQLLDVLLHTQLPINVRHKLPRTCILAHPEIPHEKYKKERDEEDHGQRASVLVVVVSITKPFVVLLDRPITTDRDERAQEHRPHGQIHQPAHGADFHAAFTAFRTVLSGGLGPLVSVRARSV